jgi:hypothetical protein
MLWLGKSGELPHILDLILQQFAESTICNVARIQGLVCSLQGHAGTVPMSGRVDSLAAAAEVILMVERRCGGGPHAGQGEGVIPVSYGDMCKHQRFEALDH